MKNIAHYIFHSGEQKFIIVNSFSAKDLPAFKQDPFINPESARKEAALGLFFVCLNFLLQIQRIKMRENFLSITRITQKISLIKTYIRF